MTSEANTEEDLDLNFSSENANTNEEQIRIEAWLDEHPDFFQEYLIRKGKHLQWRAIQTALLAIYEVN